MTTRLETRTQKKNKPLNVNTTPTKKNSNIINHNGKILGQQHHKKLKTTKSNKTKDDINYNNTAITTIPTTMK